MRQNVCQPLAPSTRRRFLLLGALRLHQRDQLARDERERDEHRRQHDAGHREDDLDVVLGEPGPNQPCRPKISTKIRPAITGDTENGRSISVISTLLPRKSNLAIAQAAATPNTRLSGTAIAAVSSVSRIADERVGLDDAPRGRRRGPSAAPRRTRTPAARTGRASGTRARRRSAAQRTQRRGSPRGAARQRAACRGGRSCLRSLPAARPRLQRVDRQQQHERDDEHHDGDRRRAGVVVLLELGDDEQRRDLRLHRHVAGDEDHRAVLADRARERQREAGDAAPAARSGRIDAPERLPARRAERRRGFLELASELLQHRLHRAHDERQADERQRDQHAERRERDLDAERLEQRADPAVRREQAGERDAGHGGRQRERQVDQRVDEPPAREAVAHEHPGDEQAEHRVDRAPRRTTRRRSAGSVATTRGAVTMSRTPATSASRS